MTGAGAIQRRHFSKYSEVLQGFGLEINLHGIWAVVGSSDIVQGWKLHLSSIPVEALDLLDVIVPFLRNQAVFFKVARDSEALSKLNEGTFGATQVGKFVTIYPPSDEKANSLAKAIIKLTNGFRGPIVPTDLRLGDVVYTRYGSFSPVLSRDRLGRWHRNIYTAEGSTREDVYEVPFVAPPEVPNPFAELVASHEVLLNGAGSGSSERDESALFGPGYLVLETIREHPRGSTFRGIDLRSQEGVSVKVLKQGRQHCMSDEYGRDIRSRLQRQELLHTLFGPSGVVPKADPYFEVEGDGYLALDWIEGQTFDSLIGRLVGNRPWGCLPVEIQLKSVSYMEALCNAVDKLHSAGYAHRDLSSSNIWVTADDRVLLLDLELAHAVDDPTPAFGMGTPGFVSPQQEAGHPPALSDDIFSLGCITSLLLTGLDPRRVLFSKTKDHGPQLAALAGGAPAILIEMAVSCLRHNPAARPTIRSLQKTIRQTISRLKEGSERDSSSWDGLSAEQIRQSTRDLVLRGQRGLLEAVLVDENSGLWASLPPELDGIGSASGSASEIRRSANRGVAGPLYVLGRLARFGYANEHVRSRAEQAVAWLVSQSSTSDENMPGLHFGEAGVAVALVEAMAGNLLERTKALELVLRNALSSDLDWPDITHGAAGQGVAAIYCAERLVDASLLHQAHLCASYLTDQQKADGSWETPPGVEGMSGQTLSGFAHGVAGIVYFLAEYARRFGTSAGKAWQAGAEWLVQQAVPGRDGEILEWNYASTITDRWAWWCHGAPGISLAFLKLYELTHEKRFGDIARKALRVHPIDIRSSNLGQCHGLSGLGEIYLEAFRVLRENEWWLRSEGIASTLISLAREDPEGVSSWLVEDPYRVVADLMSGCSGVVHFLLRFTLRGEQIGFPLLLDPDLGSDYCKAVQDYHPA